MEQAICAETVGAGPPALAKKREVFTAVWPCAEAALVQPASPRSQGEARQGKSTDESPSIHDVLPLDVSEVQVATSPGTETGMTGKSPNA